MLGPLMTASTVVAVIPSRKEKGEIKGVLRMICSLAHKCDSHYSMYNGVSMHDMLWMPSQLHGPSTGPSANGHLYHNNPYLGTYTPPASLTGTP